MTSINKRKERSDTIDGYVTIGTELDTKSFDKQIKEVESKLNDIESTLKMASKDKTLFSTSEIKQMEKEAEVLKNKLIDLNKKQAVIDNQGLGKFQGMLNNIGTGLENTIKKVTKLGLAIFGIRSAYNAVRSAMSTLSQYNEDMAANVDYIRYLLASTLEPVIRRIIELVNTLLAYVRYIVKAWTGKDIFNASKYFEKMNKSSSGIAKNMKEATKQTANFDEMNVLQDTSSSKSASGGGTGGGDIPTLTPLENVPIPEWIKWIVDNKDIVIGAIIGIASALALLKLADLLDSLKKIGDVLTPLFTFIGENATIIGGLILIIGGIAIAIDGVIKYFKDPTWENFIQILIGIGVAAAGVFLIFGTIPALITLIVGLIAALVIAIVKNWDKITETLGKVGSWIYDHIIQPVVNFFIGLWEILKSGVTTSWNFITGILGKVGNWIYTKIIQPIANFFVGLWNGIKNGVKGAFDFIKKVFGSIVSFFSGIISKIVKLFKKIGTKVGDAIGGAFKGVINGVLGAIESILNFPIKSINKLIGVINKVPGINLDKLSTFNLPRMASGGIINMPGPGVYRGGAIVGEGGPEGQIPLTNDRSLEIIGETIAKHTVINLTNITKLDNRQIAREQKTINAQSDFAYNR